MHELDKRILWELLRDARKSFTAIANENGISEDTVWKHFRAMEKQGIIVGATIQYNYKLFGYFAVANIRLNVESHNVDLVLDNLNNSSLIGTGVKVTDSLNNWPQTGEGAKGVARLYGSSYSLGMFVLFRAISGLEVAKEIITQQSLILDFDASLWLEARSNPQNIIGCLEPLSQHTSKGSRNGGELVKLDKVDMQIVDKLTVDGRMPFVKIAKEIGVSTDTVTRRFERLKKGNYIQPILQINPLTIGYCGYLSILIDLSVKGYIKEMADSLCKVPGVHDIIRLSGNYDLQVIVHVKGCQDMVNIHKEIAKIPHVKKLEFGFGETFPSWPPSRTPITTF